MENSSHLSYPRLSEAELAKLRAEIRQRRNEMRLRTLILIAAVVPEFGSRLDPFFDESTVEMKWTRLFREGNWSSDETLTLQWLRSIWENKMHVKPPEVCTSSARRF